MKIIQLVGICSLLLFTACEKQITNEPVDQNLASALTNKAVNGESELLTYYQDLSPQTLWELQQVRSATARYRILDNAKSDGFEDIHVRVENMGYHYMKRELVDNVFDLRKPEILVYNRNEDGSYELVAVEYAIPIDQPRPEGFTGDQDVWEHNEDFQLWLVHAWVWKNNPAGPFHDTNPLVQVH